MFLCTTLVLLVTNIAEMVRKGKELISGNLGAVSEGLDTGFAQPCFSGGFCRTMDERHETQHIHDQLLFFLV